MSSRITSNILTSNYLRDMRRNLNNMKTFQNQLASGKKIQNASDNPYVASRSMQLQSEMSYNQQYNENIKDTSNWLDNTDTALSQVGNVFGRIETLLVNAGNGSYSQDERTSIQKEVQEKVSELSQVLNTSFDGSYIFGGTKTDSKPTTVINGKLEYADRSGNGITRDASGIVNMDLSTKPINSSTSAGLKIAAMNKSGSTVTITVQDSSTPPATVSSPTVDLTQLGTGIPPKTLNDLFTTALSSQFGSNDINEAVSSYCALDQIGSSLNVDISQGVTTTYNKTAVDVLEFKDKTGKKINVSDLLSNIITDLGAGGNANNLTTTELTDIQSVTANLLQKRSEVGAMQNRMDSAQQNNEKDNYNMTDIVSKTEDIDFAETTMNYSMMQTVYTASLQTSAKILPMTILNYL